MLAEKGLEWESRHLDLRAGEHQKDWYIKLNPRAVVPTLIDGDIVVPESNVINEYLDERFPDPPLKPADPFGRARMRLWTKQLDEGVHDAGIAVLSFALAFRHQYLTRGEAGKEMLESIPDPAKRERRRDVIEKGLDSPYFNIAIERLLTLYRDMDKALASHAWLAGDALQHRRRGVHALRRAARASRRDGPARSHPAHRRLVPPDQGPAELPGRHRALGERQVPRADETPGPRKLA